MRPASISSRMVLSLRTIAAAVYSRGAGIGSSAGADLPIPEAVTPAGDSQRRTPVRRQAPAGRGDAELCVHPGICARCDSRLVQPVDWAPASDLWRVWRRCPECEWTGSDLITDAAAERWDEELEAGAGVLEEALETLVRINMGAEIARLRDALASDRLLPEDF